MSIAQSPLTLPVAERIRSMHASGTSVSEIANRTGISSRAVNEVVRGRRDGRPLTAREQAEEDERTGWAPLCLDGAEWSEWRRINPIAIQGAVARPCDDCPLGFAADMRAAGRCNGTPGWTPPEHEEPAVTPEETHPMPEPIVLPPADGTPVNRAQRGVIASEAVARHNGDRKAAAAELGVTTQVLGLAIHHAAPKAPRQPAAARPAPEAAEVVPEPAAAPGTAPAPFRQFAHVAVGVEVLEDAHAGELQGLSFMFRPMDEAERTERLLQLLREAYRESGDLVDELGMAAEIAPRLKRLLRQAKRLRRDIAVGWADRA